MRKNLAVLVLAWMTMAPGCTTESVLSGLTGNEELADPSNPDGSAGNGGGALEDGEGGDIDWGGEGGAAGEGDSGTWDSGDWDPNGECEVAFDACIDAGTGEDDCIAAYDACSGFAEPAGTEVRVPSGPDCTATPRATACDDEPGGVAEPAL